MKQQIFTLLSQDHLARDIYRMQLQGDTSEITAPGQFVNIKIDGLYLRRPISICDWEENSLTLIYKVVGKGTEVMKDMTPGTKLDILCSLGNGFDMTKCGTAPLLVGGGVGTPPMYGLCRRLAERGVKSTVVLGFADQSDVFYEKEFQALGADVRIATVNGSYGVKGFVTDAMQDLAPTYTYACGPIPMLKAVSDATAVSGQFSFEERMGCGFGACMGCSCETKYGNKRICRDGPVLEKEEIVW